jgi:hypothetical protein
LGTTSKETLAEEIGRDPELEAQRLADEQREEADRMDEQMLRQSQLGLDDPKMGIGAGANRDA